MGQLLYDAGSQSFDIDDRTLAHLRVVFMNKLRRSEPFLFHLPDPHGMGMRSLWIHPAVALVFTFYGSRSPVLNREWIDELMTEANGPNGLTLSPEPAGERQNA
ncbi:DUF7882 family protein [Microbacterium caowuchunii]|uniref:ATP-dependent DNA ligase n=1 Tax=Microbacterium caowuchunii TaxID=2614638 RepID=A0A5N0TD25_9MICO|nr:ATP-dependent DNA ligase [Microbacterium caowuchunii]KAA9132344.1 ATP-dependent DNA ligase [Microbacterium caowuchunii]